MTLAKFHAQTFFIENQAIGMNPHDDLNFMSKAPNWLSTT
jgi:membrane-associated HD superfamily phosphohydrolase